MWSVVSLSAIGRTDLPTVGYCREEKVNVDKCFMHIPHATICYWNEMCEQEVYQGIPCRESGRKKQGCEHFHGGLQGPFRAGQLWGGPPTEGRPVLGIAALGRGRTMV